MTSSLMAAWQRNFAERGELGASVCVYLNGRCLLELAEGWCEKQQLRAWTAETLVPVYSATKGPAAATLLCVLHAAGLTPATPVRRVWPEFPVDANFAQLLSHQCGLTSLDEVVSVLEHEEVVRAVEKQSAHWEVGTGHGYHPRSFGVLVDEPVRRLTGQSLGQQWREWIADPLDLAFWIGLPDQEFERVAQLYPGKMDKSDMEDSEFYRDFLTRGTLTHAAFASPRGMHSVAEMNTPEAWQAGLPAMGGVGTARSLAAFYQAVIGNSVEGHPSPIPEAVQHWMQIRQIQGLDRIMKLETAFHAGFMADPIGPDGKKIRQLYGPSLKAFGHPGSGGSTAFVDPVTGLSFAYTMNQMELSLFPGKKSLDLVKEVYALPEVEQAIRDAKRTLTR